jgi:hypothetical protein
MSTAIVGHLAITQQQEVVQLKEGLNSWLVDGQAHL